MQIDFSARELTLKLVYYGPALSGKTTNLSALHALGDASTRGRLMSLDTRDDRTLFFDLLPFRFGDDAPMAVRVKLFTVPGQVIHTSTRRLVLQGADGVAFVADSRVAATKENAASFLDLKANLKEHGVELRDMPLVIQFNKRDLEGVRTDAEIREQARRGKEPVFGAVATRGEGVAETFVGLLDHTLSRLDANHDWQKRFGLDVSAVVREARAHFRVPVPGAGLLGLPGGER